MSARTRIETESVQMEKEITNTSISYFFGFCFTLIVASGLLVGVVMVTLAILGIMSADINSRSKLAKFEVKDVYFQFNRLYYDPVDIQDPLASLDIYLGLEFQQYWDGTSVPLEKKISCKIPDYNVSVGSLWSRCRNRAISSIQALKVCRQVLGKLTCDAYTPELGQTFYKIYKDHCTRLVYHGDGKEIGDGPFVGDDGKVYEGTRIDLSRGCDSIRRVPFTVNDLFPPVEIYFSIVSVVCVLISAIFMAGCICYYDGKTIGRNQIRDLVSRTPPPSLPISSLQHSSVEPTRQPQRDILSLENDARSQRAFGYTSSETWERSQIQMDSAGIMARFYTLMARNGITTEYVDELREMITRVEHFELRTGGTDASRRQLSELQRTLIRCYNRVPHRPPTIQRTIIDFRKIPNTENTECPITMEEITGEYSQCSHCHRNFNRSAMNDWRNSSHFHCPLCRGGLDGIEHYTTIEMIPEAVVVNVVSGGLVSELHRANGVDNVGDDVGDDVVSGVLEVPHPNAVPETAEVTLDVQVQG
jgi:hypothetical protein